MTTMFYWIIFLSILILSIFGAPTPPGNSMPVPQLHKMNSTTKEKCIFCGYNVTVLRGIMGRLAREIVVKEGAASNDTDGSADGFESDLKKMQHELSSLKKDSRRQSNTIKRLLVRANRQRKNIEFINNFFKRWRHLFRQLGTAFSQSSNFSLPLKMPEIATPAPQQRPTVPQSVAMTTKKSYPMFPKDCHQLWLSSEHHYPGTTYLLVQPNLLPLKPAPFRVACKMTTDAGWTIIQKRGDGSVDFFRTWKEYKNGFGKLETEFWLGNEKIHQMTKQGNYKLRIEMESWEGGKYYAEYNSFKVGNESSHYKLQISGYQGNAGDSLTMRWNNHNDQPFSTWDSDHDSRYYDNCAESFKGAWWFRSCFESHLNGVYYKNGDHNNFFVRNGIQWNSIHIHSSLKSTLMMLKPV